MFLKLVVAFCSLLIACHGFTPVMKHSIASRAGLAVGGLSDILVGSLPICETSISEEEILDVVGGMSDLPDPQLTISFAVFLLVGTALLQFSLGDLTKEEGQARVRDFLATKRDTERKRGYFD